MPIWLQEHMKYQQYKHKTISDNTETTNVFIKYKHLLEA